MMDNTFSTVTYYYNIDKGRPVFDRIELTVYYK